MKVAAALVLCVVATSAHAQFKCTGPGGSVSLQQAPCAAGDQADPLHLRPPAAERPERILKAIAEQRVVIGMTRAELDRAAGRGPDSATTSVGTGAFGQQLVYRQPRRGVLYVYLTDGVVTSFSETE